MRHYHLDLDKFLTRAVEAHLVKIGYAEVSEDNRSLKEPDARDTKEIGNRDKIALASGSVELTSYFWIY